MLDLWHEFLRLFTELDVLLRELSARYGVWTYAILFAIVFAETGFVVTPFLPGDSLLFAAGALAAQGGLSVPLIMVILFTAAILGNTLNYHIGKSIGPPAFSGKLRFLKKRTWKKPRRSSRSTAARRLFTRNLCRSSAPSRHLWRALAR